MFSKKHRLAKNKDVRQTFARGRSFFNSFFRIKFKKRTEGLSRITVVVSSKVSKKAVSRNRLKRIVREFLKKNIKALEIGDYVVEPRKFVHKEEEKEFIASLENLLKKSKVLS